MTASLEVPPAQGSETPATPVFATPIRHPSAWTVADFRSPADYSIDLDAAQLRDNRGCYAAHQSGWDRPRRVAGRGF